MVLATLIFNSCTNPSEKSILEKEVEFEKRRLEQQEKELDLKEKALSQQVSTQSSTEIMQTQEQGKNDEFYIINIAAVKTENDAKAKAKELEANGNKAGYLWIPDYASLSGAKFYSVYIGPYSTQHDCEVATEEYRKIHPEAYGLFVSQDNKRIQINGIGKVTVTDKSSSAIIINIESFSKIPDEFYGAGCSYSKTKNGNPVFIEDVMGNAIMKLNGKIVKLKWLEDQNIYVGESFEVSKNTQTISTGHESVEEEGYITIKSKDGGLAKEKIYGGCGA